MDAQLEPDSNGISIDQASHHQWFVHRYIWASGEEQGSKHGSNVSIYEAVLGIGPARWSYAQNSGLDDAGICTVWPCSFLAPSSKCLVRCYLPLSLKLKPLSTILVNHLSGSTWVKCPDIEPKMRICPAVGLYHSKLRSKVRKLKKLQLFLRKLTYLVDLESLVSNIFRFHQRWLVSGLNLNKNRQKTCT